MWPNITSLHMPLSPLHISSNSKKHQTELQKTGDSYSKGLQCEQCLSDLGRLLPLSVVGVALGSKIVIYTDLQSLALPNTDI